MALRWSVVALLCCWSSQAAVAGSRVTELTPSSWERRVHGRTWLVWFAVTGCSHCKKLAPMMEHVAETAPELRVGRVNSTEHNGIARTYGVNKFPSILLFHESGVFYEFSGGRSPPRLIGFARGDSTLLGAGMPMPTELRADVSDWWLLAETLWGPLKVAATWALGIAVGLKGCALGMLKLLRGRNPRLAERSERAAAEQQQRKRE